MDYKTSKFSLTETEQDLRTGLVELIRSHVEERGISRESLSKVLDSLEFVLDDSRFEERGEQEQFYDMIFTDRKDEER